MANRRPAGDGMVRQNKRGQWEGRITVGHKSDGKPIYRYVYGKTQKETLEKLHQRIEDYRGVELTEDSKMTLGEWLDRWMNEYMIFTVRESTWDNYASLIRMHVRPYLGDKPVAFITTADVQRMYNKIKKNCRQEAHPLRGHELADSTVRSVHMMLHEAMDAAVKERLIVKNPTDGTTIPKNNYAPKQILTEAQLDKFMRVAMQDEVWRDFWYENYSKPAIRPLTQSNYENRIYDHIIPEIGKIPLNKLTQTDLQQFYARLKRNGRKQYVEKYGPGLSDRMVRACHASCRMALEKAVVEGLIRVNPAIGCKLPPKKAREMQVLTKDELQRFLAQAKEDGYYELFLLELGTGMRRGELMGLQWNDLNFDTGELQIVRQACAVNGKIEISTPKTKSSIRTVVLPPSLVEVLRKYKETVSSRWMFPSSNNPDVPRYPTSVGEILSILLKRAGCKHVRFHDLRHTFATMALENGMDVKTLSATIGHISAATTLDIYSHVTDTMQMQAAVSIDRKIGGTDAQMPAVEQTPTEASNTPVNAPCAPTEPHPEPEPRKIRKSGTGCLYQVGDNLWEGSFFPRLPGGKRKKFNVYAETKEQCEIKLAEMIERVKAEIAEEKAKNKLNNEQ